MLVNAKNRIDFEKKWRSQFSPMLALLNQCDGKLAQEQYERMWDSFETILAIASYQSFGAIDGFLQLKEKEEYDN
jgi:hypothetical protein